MLQVVLFGNDANMPEKQAAPRKREKEREQVGAGTLSNARSSDPEEGGVQVVS